MSIERPKIIDADGNEFTLPQTFNVRAEPVARKQSLLDVAFAHGARDISDGKFTPRIVEVSGRIWAASDSEYNTKWDALAAEIVKEQFRLELRGRQINVWKAIEISHAYPSQVPYPFGEVSVQFLCLDPFWYGATTKNKQFSITSSPQIFAFEVGGNCDAFPLIRIENDANNADFTIEAATDGGKSFRIQDAGALSGTELEIDCARGTAARGGSTNVISAFSGLFVRLLGGRENRFEYTGAACTINVQYREAWL